MVDWTGAVSDLELEAAGSLEDAVLDCIDFTARNLRFPRPFGGGTVNIVYPFTFTSVGPQ